MKAMKAMKKAAKATDNAVAPAMKAMKAMKAKQISGVAPGKFAKKTLKTVVKKEAKGKKDKGVDEDQIVATRTAELKSMSVSDLKDLVLTKGLEKGLKGEMMQNILAQEAKEREAMHAQAAKRKEVIVAKKKELEAMTIPDLKQLCETKGLKTGGSKPDKVDRLLLVAQQEGEIDKILAGIARETRRAELVSMSSVELQAMCVKSGIDPLMKEVMVDRIVAHEAIVKA